MTREFKPIARIESDFKSKFGIPRQSGLVEELQARIVFEPEYRQEEAFRGLENFSHIWLLWEFSENKKENWSATVKPPRLGGKIRMGVFATRSPFRPNPIGLSLVKLEQIEKDEKAGIVLKVSGADLLDGTPIYDIKPYIPVTDCQVDATEGYTAQTREHLLEVEFPEHLLQMLPVEKQQAAIGILQQDPRPAYDADPERIYGVNFADFDIHFRVTKEKVIVTDIQPY